jgi:hypothetical protein
MPNEVTISLSAVLGFAGFLIQAALTMGAIIFSHGQLTQRVRSVEEKQKDHGMLATSVTRLETEMDGVAREIKGLREDFRRVLDEFTRGQIRGARS